MSDRDYAAEVRGVTDTFGWLNVDAPDATMQIVQTCMDLCRITEDMARELHSLRQERADASPQR